MGDIAHEKLSDEQIAEMFGVMAVAGAMGQFNRRKEGDSTTGSSLLADGDDRSGVSGNMRSGPHTFMVLTKRTARIASLLHDCHFRELVAAAAYRWGKNRVPARLLADGIFPPDGPRGGRSRYWPHPNVFIGCTAENQEQADLRRPDMQRVAAAGWGTFVSYEPALGPVDWAGWEFLKQLISGGESGPKARPHHPDWHRAARDFAEPRGIAYFFKQHGEWAPGSGDFGAGRFKTVAIARDGRVVHGGHDASAYPRGASSGDGWAMMHRAGKKAAGRLLDGKRHEEFPVSEV
ncbi:DUF5131 family protein (plasmid) [Burkholderia sp. MBR-1]|nr:DUF5131 family protein [Burkholderia sp. MBR-1]